jgi:hypothetical protein
LLQLEPVAHFLPQPPQSFASVWVFTHAPLHMRCGAVHVPPPVEHTPAVQTPGARHALPQPPQLVADACVSTHAPPHTACPVLQAHFPAVHSSPVALQSVALLHSTHVPAALQ